MGKWGVSFGGRLFRVGQSPDGRWWGYFNFLGFRFFRYFDGAGNKRWTRNQSNIPYYTPNSYQPAKSTGYRIPPPANQGSVNPSGYNPTGSITNPIGSSGKSASPQGNLAAKNQQILDAIKNQQYPDQIN